jgi:hypothetical protein
MWSVKANVKAPHRFMRMGAKCWITNANYGGAADKIEIVGLSRSGRQVRTWIDSRDLINFRPGWVTDDSDYKLFVDKADAQKLCDWLNKAYGNQPIREHAAKFGASHA